MAKRMKFSVVGLPHYTVWHLYEPSVDDIRHMEEMEEERKAHEKEENEKAERMKKVKEDFHDPNSQWEKDKADIQALVIKEEQAQKKKDEDAKRAEEETKRLKEEKEKKEKVIGEGGEEGPTAQGEKDEPRREDHKE